MTGGDREARELSSSGRGSGWTPFAARARSPPGAPGRHQPGTRILALVRRDAARLIEGDDTAYAAPQEAAQLDVRLDLDAALARLPTGARTVLVMHMEGYSHGEIARLAGIAPGTARAQPWRARRAITRWIGP